MHWTTKLSYWLRCWFVPCPYLLKILHKNALYVLFAAKRIDNPFLKRNIKNKMSITKNLRHLHLDFASFASLTSGYPIIICSELIFWIIKILLLELAVFLNKKDKFLTMLLFSLYWSFVFLIRLMRAWFIYSEILPTLIIFWTWNRVWASCAMNFERLWN